MNLGGTDDEVKLAPEVMFATGRDPVAVAVGDLTGDGTPDIVTANAYDGTISVLLGQWQWHLPVPADLAVGSRPYFVALADLTGDGRLDIVTTDYGQQQRERPLEPGRRLVCALRRPWPPTKNRSRPLVGDFNGDGLPDLATINNHDNTIGVLLGNGTGLFEPAPAGSGVGLTDTPLLGDFSGNGIAGSVVLDQSGEILYRAGVPGTTGVFAPPRS